MSEVDSAVVLADLVAEGEELDALVSGQDWGAPTPAVGWTIGHQIAHLAAADANVVTAVRTPGAFDPVAHDADLDAAEGAAQPQAELLARWRAGRADVVAALREIPQDQGFPWFGAEVTTQLMAPLRLMETWAHGQDVFDALGVKRNPTARLKHVAFLGVTGRTLSFYAAGLPIPSEPLRVELTGPDGETWAWGPESAVQRIRGSALDWCLRVTHRRARAETDLTAVGDDADKWIDLARVFL
ncbi:TIGR03084 family metal-binding protein [Lentzea sp. NPDC051838]|uniref:TIGR03084 family metal-binding protein n=1 Tax=Lentzea sp. NPDC051838 TaxID=3154849 RepID=UPI003414BF60